MVKNFATQNNRTGLFSLGFVFFLLFSPGLVSAIQTDYNYSLTDAGDFKIEKYFDKDGSFTIESPKKVFITPYDKKITTYFTVNNQIKEFKKTKLENLQTQSKIYGKIGLQDVDDYQIYIWSTKNVFLNETGFKFLPSDNFTSSPNGTLTKENKFRWVIAEQTINEKGWFPFEQINELPYGYSRFKTVINRPKTNSTGNFNIFWSFNHAGNNKNYYFSADPELVNVNSIWEKPIVLNSTLRQFGEVTYFYNYTNTTDVFWNYSAANANNFRMLAFNGTDWNSVGVWNASLSNNSHFLFAFDATAGINGTYRMSLFAATVSSAFDINALHTNTSYSTCNDDFTGATFNTTRWGNTVGSDFSTTGRADATTWWFARAAGFGGRQCSTTGSLNATTFARAGLNSVPGGTEGVGQAQIIWAGGDADATGFYSNGGTSTQNNGYVSGQSTNTSTTFETTFPASLIYFRASELTGYQVGLYINGTTDSPATNQRWFPTNTQNTQPRGPLFWQLGNNNLTMDWIVYSPTFQNVTSVEQNEILSVLTAPTPAFVSPTPANGSTMNQTYFFVNTTVTGQGASNFTCVLTDNGVNTSMTVVAGTTPYCFINVTAPTVLYHTFFVSANTSTLSGATANRNIDLPIFRLRGYDESNGNALPINASITDGISTFTTSASSSDRWFWRDLWNVVGDGSITTTASAATYNSRTALGVLDSTEASTAINQTSIYLLATNVTTQFVRFHVSNNLGQGIQNALVAINRTVGGSSVQISEGLTDASGIYAITLELGATYLVRATTATCDTGSNTIVISTADYYFTCGTGIVPSLFGASQQFVQWRFEPDSSGLVGNTTLNFTAYNFTNQTTMNFTCFSVAYSNGTGLYYADSGNSNGTKFSYRTNANDFTSGGRLIVTGCFRVTNSSTTLNYTKTYTFFFGSPPGPYLFNLGAVVGTLYYSLGSIAYVMLAAITSIFSAAWVRKFTPSGQASFLVAGVLMGVFLVAIPESGAAFGVGVLLLGGLGAAGLYYMFKGR